MNHFSSNIYYKMTIIVIGILLLCYLFIFNPPRDRPDNVYESSSFNHSQFSHVHFNEVEDALGINYRHRFPTGKENPFGAISNSPSLSVVDINNDGFMDLFITTEIGQKNLLYINHQGKYFTEEAEKYNLANLNTKEVPSYALWLDINHDGLIDLVFARYGCHSLFLSKKVNGHIVFEKHDEMLNGYCSKPAGLNVADFYGDGSYGLVFSNFLNNEMNNEQTPNWSALAKYDNIHGGKNHLLKFQNNKFIVDKNADFLTNSFSHNAGVADINLDGRPDVFFSNDYAHDEMFLNLGGGKFEDVTNAYIPREFHGLSGMNTEFFDYDRDGRIDLYVSNTHKPPFSRNYNLLWKKKENNLFEVVSTKIGNAKCGFSWAAKFSDFDNDGEDDLFVVNGRNRSPGMKSMKDGKSFWFERNSFQQITPGLRKYAKASGDVHGKYGSAFERKCLFMQKNGHFYDIAEMAKVNDTEENRGMVIWDYDNDGKMDMATSGPLAKVKIFHNESQLDEKKHQWIGFIFKVKNGNIINHGLRISFSLDNQKKIVREVYPANGYRGFNDPRIHVGLGDAHISSDLEVYWPVSRKIKKYNQYKINQYNEILE